MIYFVSCFLKFLKKFLCHSSILFSLASNFYYTSLQCRFTESRILPPDALLVQVQVQHWRENGFADDRALYWEKEVLLRLTVLGMVHAKREVDALYTMRVQSGMRNRRAGYAGSEERASSRNLQPEIFVILKWNCPRARMPWHGSLLPFEIVHYIGVVTVTRTNNPLYRNTSYIWGDR